MRKLLDLAACASRSARYSYALPSALLTPRRAAPVTPFPHPAPRQGDKRKALRSLKKARMELDLLSEELAQLQARQGWGVGAIKVLMPAVGAAWVSVWLDVCAGA